MTSRETSAANDAIDTQASALMKHGIHLVNGASQEELVEAVACFDRALDLRRQLPVESVPGYAYGLAACLLNRAEALMGLGHDRLGAAVAAFDEAITVLRSLPLEEDPRFSRRLGIAHQNRGLALQASGAPVAAATAAFETAIAVLEDDRASQIPDRPYLLAAIWTNLANARAQATVESGASAGDAALRALGLIGHLEADDVSAAEVGLKARHVFCQAIARRLSQPAEAEAAIQDVHAATDTVDAGLELARQWERKGVERFRAIALDLFRFGARLYRHYQPQFLSEFVAENMDPARSSPAYVESPEMRAVAREAIGG